VSKCGIFKTIKIICYVDSTPEVLRGKYSSELNENSSTHSQGCLIPEYYYEAIKINVDDDGNYKFGVGATISTKIYLYEDSFDPLFIHQNRIEIDLSDYTTRNQFNFMIHLRMNITYILVVTASDKFAIGKFSIVILGPNNVTLERMGKDSN